MLLIKKFEDYVVDLHQVSLADEVSSDIPTFGEYRKGSTKYGGLVSRMMDWLRLQREKQKNEKMCKITTTFDTFVTETGIKLSELEDFIKDKISKGLYNFEIAIDYDQKQINFNNLENRNTKLLAED